MEVLRASDVEDMKLRAADARHVASYLGRLDRVLRGVGRQQDLRREVIHHCRPFLRLLRNHSTSGATSRAISGKAGQPLILASISACYPSDHARSRIAKLMRTRPFLRYDATAGE